MLNSTIQHALAQYRRSVLLIGAPILLSACVAAPVENTSSSSEAAASSETLVSSSSEMVASVSSSVMTVSSSSVAISSVQSSSSEVVVSSSVEPVSSSSLMPSSSSVASSSSEVASSSSQVQSSSSAAVSMLSCDVSVAQHAYYLNLDLVTVSNDGSADLASWEVSFDLWFTPQNPNFNGLNGTQANYELSGQTLTVTGGALAAGEAATFSFGANTGTADTPDVVCKTGGESSSSESSTGGGSSSSVAPPPPPPIGTGPVANGLCAANTGLGNGSATKGIVNAVLDDGTAVHVKGGVASQMKYSDGSYVTDAIAVNNGDYAATGACVARTDGSVHCGAYDMISTTPQISAGADVVYLTTGSDINNSSCALTADGDLICSKSDDESLGGAVKPYSYAHCGRLGCCVIDANDEVHCSALDPSTQPAGKPLIVGASDYGYCVVTDAGKSHCWLTQDFQGVNAGGLLYMPQSNPVEATPLSESVISYAGGQFHSCWLTSAGKVLCSGGGNTANGAAGDSQGADVAMIKMASGDDLSNIVAINGGRGSACGVDTSGDLYCWGDTGGGGVSSAVKVELGSKKVRMPTDCAM